MMYCLNLSGVENYMYNVNVKASMMTMILSKYFSVIVYLFKLHVVEIHVNRSHGIFQTTNKDISCSHKYI